MRALVWFREDLRIADNSALYFASQKAKQGIAAIYLITPSFWQRHDMAVLRQEFIFNAVNDLSQNLQAKNISLKIVTINDEKQIAQALYQYAASIKADVLFFNKQYEIDELARDEKVNQFFSQHNLKTFTFDDQIIFKPEEVKTQEGRPFKVYTAFKNAWIKAAEIHGVASILPEPKSQAEMIDEASSLLTLKHTAPQLEFWPAQESYAKKRLQSFITKNILQYHLQRDYPAEKGTSKLSTYLNTGLISIRTCMHAALKKANQNFSAGPKGVLTWMNELLWREFYKHLLITFPHISKNKPFKQEYQNIKWRDDEQAFLAWQQGQTGFPFVDAGMRQLQRTGWMHNRLRMVVAMFLTKTLFIDWRLGEKFFMQHLIDGDLAANNGGWQWCASTGADAVPYFRIFNPYSQIERFDPEGKFIREYCPEIAMLDNKQIHNPYNKNNLIEKINYPHPIIDHDKARKETLQKLKKLHSDEK
jgi:deoxyribodipyrimidine photo-lyase